MLKRLLDRFAAWSGDHHLDAAIRKELRRGPYAVGRAKTSHMRLIAVLPPGWVQVRRFVVDTVDDAERSVTLLGLARDDGRRSRIEVLLTTDRRRYQQQVEAWCEGLIRRGA